MMEASILQNLRLWTKVVTTLAISLALTGCNKLSFVTIAQDQNQSSGSGNDDGTNGDDGGENNKGSAPPETNPGPTPPGGGDGDGGTGVKPPTPKLPNHYTKTETFNLETQSGKVDILVIVDNSKSMYDIQSEMGTRMGSFFSHLNDIDWQLAITTTDILTPAWAMNGKFLPMDESGLKVLHPKVPQYRNKFLETVTREETLNCDNYNSKKPCPSGTEQPLAALLLAIERPENQDFFREDAGLVVFVLSDEDEMSSGPPNATSPDFTVDRVRSRLGQDKIFTTYGLIVQPGDTVCKSKNPNRQFGTFVQRLADLTTGMTESICNKDFSKPLSKIGQAVKDRIYEVELSSTPTGVGLKVEFSPAENQVPYEVKERRLIFKKKPKTGTQVKVEYQAIIVDQPKL